MISFHLPLTTSTLQAGKTRSQVTYLIAMEAGGPCGSRTEATPLTVAAQAADAPRLSPVAPLVRPQASATAPWWPASSALRNRSTTSGAKP